LGVQRSEQDTITMRTLILTLTLLLAAASQAQVLLGQEHYPDGTLKSTAYTQGERTHFITYHENGRVKEMGSYRNGKLDGLWKQYTDTGALLTRATFRNGTRQGVWEFRTEADQPLGTLRFSNGVLTHGEQYNEQGDLVAQRDYR
jgi:antitoxin component YwqK of YwqJK toxin-antitoxin module